MKHSPYITWAKSHHEIEYNLGSSGVPAPSLTDLVNNPKDILKSDHHEDGWQPLLDRIAKRYEIGSEQVVTVHSASFANHMVCALLLDPGDEVLVEDPAYEPLVSLPKYFNAEVKRFSRKPPENYQPNPDEIEQKITQNTRLIILSDLHNPSGTLLDRDILDKIIELAEKYEAKILIDEVYLEFLYPNGKRTSANRSDLIITTRSLTKAFGLDDIRVGWIIAEKKIAEKIRRLLDLFMTSMAFPSERLGAVIFDQADELLEQNMELLTHNFKLVEELIDNYSELSWQAPQFGSVGFVKYKSGNTNQLIEYAIKNYSTTAAPGRFFGMPEYFRIGWGLPTDILEEGLNRLGKAIKEH